MKKVTQIYPLVFLLLISIVGVSCNGQQRYNSPQGYDLNAPVKIFMPDALTEISGIAFHGGKANRLYAEQDEEGKVYYFSPADIHLMSTTFAKKGDYEDLAIVQAQVVVLRSDGALFVFPFNQLGKPVAGNVQKWDNLLPAGEYEGLYADEKNGQLYVLCKNCGDVFSFKLSPDGILKPVGQFHLNTGIAKFRPSALARNPKTNEWYIVSSVNKSLVVTDAGWKVKAVYPLNSSLFSQPEGIAFDNQNNLYISNEGDKTSKGTVLKFNYKK